MAVVVGLAVGVVLGLAVGLVKAIDNGVMDLAALAALGPYFRLERLADGPAADCADHDCADHGLAAAPRETGWRPGLELASADGVDVLVGPVAHRMAARVPRPSELRRVAGSTAHLSLVGRLLSPLLVLASLDLAPAPELEQLWWRPPSGHGGDTGNIVDLAVSASTASRWLDGESGDGLPPSRRDWAEWVGTALLAPVAAAFEASGVPEQTLLGNEAAAVRGALDALSVTSPATAARTTGPGVALLQSTRLAPTWTGTPFTPGFRRRSCCLVYRALPGERLVCGDCVLARAPA
ncbi:hypothetical protein GCM10025862_37840 [Arsenicicoccus piscis]|uniref:Ferric siderophore reductase C-terminal domain-containing protein n=2 Tax=Arsenicicoccus piscis TaxID=673954 RepID=A0ABQ6HTC6_9MICO|nr:hypothetical protein GCM10025862_37840 [Arsenicicoccus piscis]